MLHNFFKKVIQKSKHKITRLDLDETTYYNRGIDCYEAGKLNQAIVEFDKVILLNPNNKDAYICRALIFYDQKKLKEATIDLKYALKIDPNDSDAYINLGLVYDELKKYDKALIFYDKAIELNPEEGDAYNNRALVFYNQGKLDKASADYNKAIELEPNDPTVYYNRAMTFLNQGKVKQAIADFNKVIELNREDKDAHSYLNKALKLYKFLRSLSILDDEERKNFAAKKKKCPYVSPLLKRAGRINVLMKRYELSFEQAESYLINAANKWLFHWLFHQQEILINNNIPIEIYLLITSYVLGVTDALKIVNVANEKIFLNTMENNLSNFKLGIFTAKQFLEKQKEAKERYESRLIQ